MTNAQLTKQIEQVVEQKLAEFLGDPDAGLSLNKVFVAELRARMKGERTLTSMASIARKHGVR